MNRWCWPLEINQIRRGSERHTFGMVRANADGSPRAHQGWDFAAQVGTPCYAVGSGVVRDVSEMGALGLCVLIDLDGPEGWYALYAHLESAAVKPNQAVSVGAPVGRTGNSGNAWSLDDVDDHLHFELRTEPYPGRGLAGRLSPLRMFASCPLRQPVRRMPESAVVSSTRFDGGGAT